MCSLVMKSLLGEEVDVSTRIMTYRTYLARVILLLAGRTQESGVLILT